MCDWGEHEYYLRPQEFVDHMEAQHKEDYVKLNISLWPTTK